MAQFDLKKATIYFRDGTPTTPKELEIKVGDGKLSYDETRNIEYKNDRGVLDSVREGDEVPVDVSLDIRWDFLRSDTGEAVTPEEFLKKVGNASAYVSTGVDPCEPYAIDIVVEYDLECGTVLGEIITLDEFRWEKISHDLKAGTLSVSGKCKAVEAVVVRSSI